MNCFKSICTFLGLLVLPSMGFSHGEDKPGPHKGYIQMPGGFHTELVPISASRMHVYLLDLEWKNPLIENSSVELRHSFGKRSLNAKCSAAKDHFVCEFPDKVNMKKGQIDVKATRDHAAGNIAIYNLPLKRPKKSSMAPMDHSSHSSGASPTGVPSSGQMADPHSEHK